MFRIAICDDQEAFVQKAIEYVNEILTLHQIKAEVIGFTSAEELIQSFKSMPFDFIMLDIDMPQINGFDAAGILRAGNIYFTLIFLSGMEHMAIESIQYAPFRFARKEFMHEDLKSALLKAIEKHQFWNTAHTFKTKDKEEIKLSLQEIVYFQLSLRRIELHTEYQSYELTIGKLTDYEKQYADQGFALASRSYLVNLSFVDRFEGKLLYLKTGLQIPMWKDKTKVEDFKKKFYYFKKERRI